MIEENINKWPKTITVDKRIVGILSTSTYKNFPRALKEIITNSYDADALEVDIKIDIENETITIEDNGKGMSSIDFGFYLRIAGKTRKKNENTTEFGRKIIGQFGVGFLSVFPFFKSYSIESSKAGSETALFADIPLAKYFDSENSSLDVGSIIINGGEKPIYNSKSKSYTKVVLKGFNDLTRSFFKNNFKKNSLEVATYEGIEKLKWILSDDLPLEYKEDKFNKIFNYPYFPKFTVKINNDILYRGVYGHQILDTHSNEYDQIGAIKFKYFIATPMMAVKPIEGRFIKIRNLNVGVGDERTDFSELRGGNRSKLKWLTGEVHIIDGMNDLIKVSREGFNYSNDYEKLKDFFNEKLNHFSTRLENEMQLEKEIKQTGKEFRVHNVSNLNPEVLQKKIEKFKSDDYNVDKKFDNKERNKLVLIPNKSSNDNIVSQRDNDDIIKSLEKYIFINSKRFHVKSDSWDYINSTFPACKLINNEIIINSKYPLFKGIKFTDVFVKMHLMLIFNLEDKVITQDIFNKLTSDILTFYSDYLK